MFAVAPSHIPPAPIRPVRIRRYADRSPSRFAPERHRQLAMPSDELFESDREDCEEAGTSFRLLPPPCASPSSSHRPFLSYLLINRTSRRDSRRNRRSHHSPRLTFTATTISWSDPRYP